MLDKLEKDEMQLSGEQNEEETDPGTIVKLVSDVAKIPRELIRIVDKAKCHEIEEKSEVRKMVTKGNKKQKTDQESAGSSHSAPKESPVEQIQNKELVHSLHNLVRGLLKKREVKADQKRLEK